MLQLTRRESFKLVIEPKEEALIKDERMQGSTLQLDPEESFQTGRRAWGEALTEDERDGTRCSCGKSN
jgi:hypothetical protein